VIKRFEMKNNSTSKIPVEKNWGEYKGFALLRRCHPEFTFSIFH